MTMPGEPPVISPTPTFPPDKKIWSGGLAGLVTWGILWGLGKAGIVVDPNLQGLITLAVGYAVSYLVPPALRDVVSRVNNQIVQLANADQTNSTTAKVVSLGESKQVAAADVASGAVPADEVLKSKP